MDIRTVYERRYLIPEDSHKHFHRKEKLNAIELLGLEAILVAFIHHHEQEEYGEVYVNNLIDFTHYNQDSVDILDGDPVPYIFENYGIEYVWMTENGIPVLSCYLLESDEYNDPFEVAKYTDWMRDCKHVLFRLD